MALTPFAFDLIAPHLRGARVLALGYPDVLVPREELAAQYGLTLQATSPHGASHKLAFPLAETVEVFRSLGARSVVCVDVKPSRGVELAVDLNEPQAWAERFDLVLDAGTIEHCANIGQALMNAANAVADGGRVFHGTPANMLNHGFYNVSPTLFHDFYTQNGWTIEHLSGSWKAGFMPAPIMRVERFNPKQEILLNVIARRVGDVHLHWPTQSKYG